MPDWWNRALLACCIPIVLAACDGPADTIGAHELSLAARDLASNSAEAALLTRQLAAGSVTSSFAWVHAQALGRASTRLADRLARPARPEQQAQQERLLQLQARFVIALESVGFAATDRARLEALDAGFTQVGALAAAIGDEP